MKRKDITFSICLFIKKTQFLFRPIKTENSPLQNTNSEITTFAPGKYLNNIFNFEKNRPKNKPKWKRKIKKFLWPRPLNWQKKI